MSGGSSTTWARLKQRAEYQLRRVLYLGGGLAGLGLFGAGDVAAGVFDELEFLRAAFLISALITGGCLGLAWEKSLRFAAEVERDHGHELGAETSKVLPPEVARGLTWAVVFLLLTALTLAVASVWAAID